LATAAAAHQSVVAHDGWAEQDPRAWWDGVVHCLRTLKSDQPEAHVACVGMSGQMDGPVLLDSSGDSLGTCHIWADSRATNECEEISSLLGNDRIIALTGKPPAPAYTAPKLLWIRQHEPDRYRLTAKVILPKDYVRMRLTGSIATDPSDASNTLLFDIIRQNWSEEISSALDVPPQLLPDVIPSTSHAGAIPRQVARRLGLLADTPVVTGAGDSIAAATASGLVPGVAALTVIGSAGNVSVALDVPAVDPKGRIHTGCYSTDQSWIATGVQQAAGLALRWLRDCLRSASQSNLQFDDLVRQAERVPAGSRGLIFLPHLIGERSPEYNPHSRGVFFGLSMEHSAAHLARAVMEGVAYAQRESIDALKELGVAVERLQAAGGGARSRLWRSIQASVNRLPVTYVTARDQSADSSALGAAMMAGVHASFYPTLEDGARLYATGREEIEQPNETDAALYEDAFHLYRQLSRSLSPAFATLVDLKR
jgi:xylulokinase